VHALRAAHGATTVVLTMVTEAVKPRARPVKVVCMVCPAVEIVTPAGADDGAHHGAAVLDAGRTANLPEHVLGLRTIDQQHMTWRGAQAHCQCRGALEHPHRIGIALRIQGRSPLVMAKVPPVAV